MSNEKILMSAMEYQELLNEQEETYKRLQTAYLERTGVRIATATAEASHNMNEITRLSAKLDSIRDRLRRAEVVSDVTAEICELGDILQIAIITGDTRQESTVRLVGEANFATDGIPQISMSSPLGKAIYHQPIGSIQSYNSPNGAMMVEIVTKKFVLVDEVKFIM